jgi:hypothetical protein
MSFSSDGITLVQIQSGRTVLPLRYGYEVQLRYRT